MCKNNKDHCGPTVVNFKTWLLSWLVPDNLWEVYIGDLCQEHDVAYELGGNEEDKEYADRIFSDDVGSRVLSKLTKRGMKWKKAYARSETAAQLYYLGVHIGGKEHFNYNGR